MNWRTSPLPYLGAVGGGLMLLLFLAWGFHNDWKPRVNPYRERYFYDDSSARMTDWRVTGLGDVDADGHADFAVKFLFDPESEDCRASAWVLSGRTGEGIVRLGIQAGEARRDRLVGWGGDCSDFRIERLDEDPRGVGPRAVLSSLLHSNSRGIVYVLDLREQAVVRRIEGSQENEDFGWSFGGVADLDGDGVNDRLISSRARSTVQAFSGADGVRLWSLEFPEYAGPAPSWAKDMEPWNWVESILSLDDMDADAVPDIALASPGAGYFIGSLLLVSGRTGTMIGRLDGEPSTTPGVPDPSLGRPIETIRDRDGDGRKDLLVGALTLPSRILASRGLAWVQLPRPLYRARSVGDIDADGAEDFVGAESHRWDPEEIVVVSGQDGRII